jgi:hypothetical protein
MLAGDGVSEWSGLISVNFYEHSVSVDSVRTNESTVAASMRAYNNGIDACSSGRADATTMAELLAKSADSSIEEVSGRCRAILPPASSLPRWQSLAACSFWSL